MDLGGEEVGGGSREAIFYGTDWFDPFDTWPHNQRYKRFGQGFTAVCENSSVETAMVV